MESRAALSCGVEVNTYRSLTVRTLGRSLIGNAFWHDIVWRRGREKRRRGRKEEREKKEEGGKEGGEGEKKGGTGSYQYLVVVITLPLDVTINIIK